MSAMRQPLAKLPCALADVVPATELRGTIIATSLALAREHHLDGEYFRLLPAKDHARIRSITAITWVPLDLALTHYRVMAQLFPSATQQVENGRKSSERTQNVYLRTLFQLAQAAGQLDPFVALARLPAIFGRMWNGGGAPTAFATGPKDARVELLAYPILEVAYVRCGWQGMLESGLALTTRRVFVRPDPSFEGYDRVAFEISWV